PRGAASVVARGRPCPARGARLTPFFPPADGPALLIFHGNGEAISGWVDALALLHQANIAAMVFDYSGFGNSPGEPTVANFHADALAAWHTFRVRVPAGGRARADGPSPGRGGPPPGGGGGRAPPPPRPGWRAVLLPPPTAGVR